MKTIFSASITALMPVQALAHPSVFAHDHPHGVSILPDVGALLVAALLIGAGLAAFRYFRKG